MLTASQVRRVVVLGTGTEVGKTFVTTALAGALNASGHPVAAVKPVETGHVLANDDPPSGSDAERLELAATPVVVRPHPLHVFREPISPHLAARRAGVPINVSDVLRWVAQAESGLQDTAIHYTTQAYLLIETAGGALSPLGEATSNLDLALALEPALWLLVAPDNLGVLHDLRATLAALRALARSPDFIVLSAARPPDHSTGTNGPELVRLGIATPAAVLGRDDPEPARSLADAIRARVA